MNFNINYTLDNMQFSAHVVMLDSEYKYFQVTPETDYPFFIKFSPFEKKWVSVAGIYDIDPKVVELVGIELSRQLDIQETAYVKDIKQL